MERGVFRCTSGLQSLADAAHRQKRHADHDLMSVFLAFLLNPQSGSGHAMQQVQVAAPGGSPLKVMLISDTHGVWDPALEPYIKV